MRLTENVSVVDEVKLLWARLGEFFDATFVSSGILRSSLEISFCKHEARTDTVRSRLSKFSDATVTSSTTVVSGGQLGGSTTVPAKLELLETLPFYR